MTFQEIFEKVREEIYANDLSGLEGHLAVQVNIIGEGEGAFYIELLEGKVYVEPYEYYDRDCIFIITADDFFRIIEGKLNPVVAFTSGKLKVQGSIDKALEFQKISDRVKNKTEVKSKTEVKDKPAAKSKTAGKGKKA
ncbi:MAG: SCP2 sterol-binding domain-containing protein [Oscillospiraceae bacterium]